MKWTFGNSGLGLKLMTVDGKTRRILHTFWWLESSRNLIYILFEEGKWRFKVMLNEKSWIWEKEHGRLGNFEGQRWVNKPGKCFVSILSTYDMAFSLPIRRTSSTDGKLFWSTSEGISAVLSKEAGLTLNRAFHHIIRDNLHGRRDVKSMEHQHYLSNFLSKAQSIHRL